MNHHNSNKKSEQRSASQSRRTFIRTTAVAVGLAPMLKVLSDVPESFAQAPATTPVDEASPMAQALGYVHDHTKANVAKFPTAKDAIDKGNVCSKCVLMTEQGLKATGKEGAWGRCSLFPTGLVAENGWCMSFAPKPA